MKESSLVLTDLPSEFELEIVTKIDPEANTALEGLYKSGGAFCTQCEAEGFRRITYYLDRPDVLAKYTTKVIADKAVYPYLLSNGNRIAEGDAENGRHWFNGRIRIQNQLTCSPLLQATLMYCVTNIQRCQVAVLI
ncbi:membrane alanine aminopeptidase N [Vibrio sp. JCM 18904]|nr:membrane alanine aminopeptidase N [Vibrio sp. JCM 18904]